MAFNIVNSSFDPVLDNITCTSVTASGSVVGGSVNISGGGNISGALSMSTGIEAQGSTQFLLWANNGTDRGLMGSGAAFYLGNTATGGTMGMTDTEAGDFVIYDANKPIRVAGGGTTTVLSVGSSNVGVGTLTPLNKISIRKDSGNTTLANEIGIVGIANLDSTVGTMQPLGFATFDSGIGQPTLTGIITPVITDNTTTSFDSDLIFAPVANSIPVERLRITSIGSVGIGTAAPVSSALCLGNSIGSMSGTADMVKLGSYDLSAGNATLSMATETAVATDAALVSTHSLTVRINGASYKVMLVAV